MRSSDSFGKSDESFKKLWDGASHDKQIHDTKHDEIVVWLYQKLKTDNRMLLSLFKDRPSDIVLGFGLAIEHPIMAHNGRVQTPIGFADLCVNVVFEIQLSQEQIAKNELAVKEKHAAHTICPSQRSKRLYVEVKSKVNIGETIRQINYYSVKDISYPNNQWAVCAPIFPGYEILLEQGILFIEYDPGLV